MEEHEADVFSLLPSDLLFHIICLLPLESARQTPFVSERCRFVWNSGSLLQHGSRQDLASALFRFIENFYELDPTKNIGKLEFHFDERSIVSAIIGRCEALRLRFSSEQETYEEFQWRLEINPNASDRIPRRVPVPGSFFVKTLCLVSVNHLTHEVVASMVLDFPFLENVKVSSCSGLASLTIDSAFKLLHLSILDCPHLRFLGIRSFKLKTLRYRGSLPSIKIREHFNLSEAAFDIRRGPKYNTFNISEFGPVLLIIKNSETLALCRWMFEELIIPSISSSETAFQFYKLQELRWIDNSLEQENIHSLISFLILCPSIKRLFITIDPNTYTSERAISLPNNVTKHTRIDNMFIVKFEGPTSEKDKTRAVEALQEMMDIYVHI
ncbi:PREDICTED: F-box protein At2g39490-like [Tarenaya hassleriana]|uniref:F-box protein At2g39490-like n=1 Tax=Tarenaya hassleriana TaxID=28532 RepID=UPI00053C987E|nr:PREDICTED: F-box protein At2g39490-like [Tarenaya hassleriana]